MPQGQRAQGKSGRGNFRFLPHTTSLTGSHESVRPNLKYIKNKKEDNFNILFLLLFLFYNTAGRRVVRGMRKIFRFRTLLPYPFSIITPLFPFCLSESAFIAVFFIASHYPGHHIGSLPYAAAWGCFTKNNPLRNTSEADCTC